MRNRPHSDGGGPGANVAVSLAGAEDRRRDHLPLLGFLVIGLILVSLCRYSLEQLSAFNAIILAACAGSKQIRH